MCLPSSTIDTSYPVLRVPSPFSAADATGRLNYAKLVCFIVLYSRVISSRPGAPSSRLAMLPVHEAVAKPKAGRATRQRFVDPVDLGLDPIDLGLDPVDLGLDLVDLGLDPVDLGLGPVDLGLDPIALGLDPVDLGNTVNEIDRIKTEIDRIKAKVDRIKAKIDRIKAKIDRIKAKIDRIKAKVDRIEAEIRKVGNSLLGAPACLWFDNDVAGRE